MLTRRKRASAPRTRRRRPWAGLGLRARLTVTFGLGALALSASMAGLTYFTARQFTLSQRQQADVRATFLNASAVVTKLRAKDTQYVGVLESLDTSGSKDTPGSKSALVIDGQVYSPHLITIPNQMLDLVESTNTAATQRVDVNGSSELVVGVSLPGVQAEYFDVFPLEDLATELRFFGLVLATVALVTTVAGAAVGRLAAGRVLLPLVSVSQAAETIAGGRLDTRLEAVGDADLATLASSFNRMADALQDRIRHEARFTSDVSHELRSPLTTLSNALGVLDSHRADLDPRGRRALELLDIEVRRFQRMVDDLLEISRMDAGSAELLLDEVEVGELVRQAAASTGAGAVPVDVAPSTVGVRLLVDKRRIERVVANLVENAAQYAGGATRLAVEPAPGAVRIVVADHGPGVPAAERTKVFDRFYRGQSSGQRGATNGTGLGLALVAEHVHLHGGRVWVEDGTGAENRFIVELPLPDPDELHDELAGDAQSDRPLDRAPQAGSSENGSNKNRRAAKKSAASSGRYSRR